MAYLIGAETDDATMHASLHGVIRRSELSYFKDNLRRAAGRASGVASRFLSRSLERLENFSLDRFRDGVEAVRDRISHRWDEDRIRDLASMDDFQQSKRSMRRWLMSSTRARKLYYGDKISGFGGRFDQTEGEYYGDELRDYRNVMHGAYVGTDEEDRYVTYLDILEDESSDDILSPDQRAVILSSIEMMERLIDAGGQDPTSPAKTLL